MRSGHQSVHEKSRRSIASGAVGRRSLYWLLFGVCGQNKRPVLPKVRQRRVQRTTHASMSDLVMRPTSSERQGSRHWPTPFFPPVTRPTGRNGSPNIESFAVVSIECEESVTTERGDAPNCPLMMVRKVLCAVVVVHGSLEALSTSASVASFSLIVSIDAAPSLCHFPIVF